MNIFKLFLQFEFGKVGKYFKTKALPKAITSILFFVVFVLLGIGVYSFFLSGFRYIYFGIEEAFRLPLLLFIYEVFLLALAGVIVVSSVVSGVFNLFRNGYNTWLIGSPSYHTFPKLIFIKSLITSTWPLLIIFLPVVIAFTKIYSIPFGGLALLLISMLFFLLLANTATLSTVVLLGFLYYHFARISKLVRFTFKGFISILFTVITVLLVIIWRVIANIDLVKLFRADDADAVVTVTTIGNYFTWFPTHPFAMEIISLQGGAWGEALMYGGVLALLAIATLAIWWKVSSLFYPLWQAFQEGNTAPKEDETTLTRKREAYQFSGSGTMALFKKEALVSSRNWKGILWFLFLSGIWVVQIGGSLIMEHNIRRHAPDISATMNTLQILQFIIAAYFISAFTLRFVFPSFSVEKKTAWILRSAPLRFTKIFFGKYLFYTLFFVFVGVLMNYINVNVLDVAVSQASYSMLLLVSTIVFIVTLGLSLGALFPNTETDDPEVISTSMSGLFFTTLALVYAGAGAWVLRHTLLEGSVSMLLLFVVTSLVLVGVALISVPYYLAGKKTLA